MEEFWKTIGTVLLAVILCLTVGRQERDLSVLLSLAAICATAVVILSYLVPVLDFLRGLEQIGNLQNGMLDILIKAIGVSISADLAGLLCTDAGYGSLGKSLRLLGNAAVLYLSIPVFQMLLDLLQDILGNL